MDKNLLEKEKGCIYRNIKYFLSNDCHLKNVFKILVWD